MYLSISALQVPCTWSQAVFTANHRNVLKSNVLLFPKGVDDNYLLTWEKEEGEELSLVPKHPSIENEAIQYLYSTILTPVSWSV